MKKLTAASLVLMLMLMSLPLYTYAADSREFPTEENCTCHDCRESHDGCEDKPANVLFDENGVAVFADPLAVNKADSDAAEANDGDTASEAGAADQALDKETSAGDENEEGSDELLYPGQAVIIPNASSDESEGAEESADQAEAAAVEADSEEDADKKADSEQSDEDLEKEKTEKEKAEKEKAEKEKADKEKAEKEKAEKEKAEKEKADKEKAEKEKAEKEKAEKEKAEKDATEKATASLGGKFTPSGIAYKDLSDKIQSYISKHKDKPTSLAICYFDKDEDVVKIIHGDVNDGGEAADENTVYEWGSVSKMHIWASVMQLVEDGKIDLDEDVRNYLSKDFLDQTKISKPVTMRQLMNHTGGFQETYQDIEFKDPKNLDLTLKEALIKSAPPQINEPGEVSSYSNRGAALAAHVVEEVSGQEYDDYVHEHIFEPLGMKDTYIRADGSDNPNIEKRRENLNCYLKTPNGYQNLGKSRSYINIYPAGATTGTLSDMVKFAKAFNKGSENSKLLFKNPETLDKMLEPSLKYSDGTPRMSHGLLHMPYGVPLVGHAGNTDGFSSNLMLDPENGTGVVIITNEAGETEYNYGLLNEIYGDYQPAGGNFAKDDLSGIYRAERNNFDSDILKAQGSIGGLMPLKKTETSIK